METQERQYVMDQLKSSASKLLSLTDGLSDKQWNFRESPERWTILENLEHCLIVDRAVTGIVQHALGKPAEPAKMASVAGKEPHVMQVHDPRGREIVAVPELQPVGRVDGDQMRQELRELTDTDLTFMSSTDAALREHFFPHPKLGDLDLYQWLIIQAQHGARHAWQIERIMRDQAYPA